MILTMGCAGLGAFQYVSPGCSWYEHHMLGGCQRPPVRSECIRKQDGPPDVVLGHSRPTPARLMIIIPFKGDRHSASFSGLCDHLPAHLSSKGIEFRMIAVNQSDSHPFNRAALVNAAYAMLAQSAASSSGLLSHLRRFTYLAVHDIDRFPVRRNISCLPYTQNYYEDPGNTPRVLHPTSYTGGVLVIRRSLFEAVNGFSNLFWGWGHEDNEFYMRLRWCGLVPVHAPEIDWCMEHNDCAECKSAKPLPNNITSLWEETRKIALLQERVRYPAKNMAWDGLSSVNFTIQSSPRRARCGKHWLHFVDIALDRANKNSVHSACMADGGENDDGCVASVQPSQLPSGVVACVRRALPSGMQNLPVTTLAAKRSRAMYNFNYEVDVQVQDRQARAHVFRVAVCAHEWQGPGAQDASRYHPMWRASIARRSFNVQRKLGNVGSDDSLEFVLSKDFRYQAHFPCTLHPTPWQAR